LISWNFIKLDYKVNLSEFRDIFEWLFKELKNIDRTVYSIRSTFEVYDLEINYRKDWKVIIWFDLNWKNINIYLYRDKILFIKVDWKILKQKNIPLDTKLNDFLLKLK
jgi:hypothetical protein